MLNDAVSPDLAPSDGNAGRDREPEAAIVNRGCQFRTDSGKYRGARSPERPGGAAAIS